jgi:hypothetical protein
MYTHDINFNIGSKFIKAKAGMTGDGFIYELSSVSQPIDESTLKDFNTFMDMMKSFIDKKKAIKRIVIKPIEEDK